MNETRAKRNLPRSIGAGFAGLLAIVVLSTATDAALHASGVFPPPGRPMADGLWLLATAYRAVYAIAGCYLAARLAPARPMLHAMVLGFIGVAVSTAGTVVTWGKGPEFGPHWYPISLIVTALPCAWLGGRLHREPAPGGPPETAVNA